MGKGAEKTTKAADTHLRDEEIEKIRSSIKRTPTVNFRISEQMTFYGQAQGATQKAPAKTTLLLYPNNTFEISGVVEFKNQLDKWAQQNFYQRGEFTYNDFGYEVRFNFRENSRHKDYRMLYYNGVLTGDNLKLETDPLPGYVGDLQMTNMKELTLRNGTVTDQVNDSGYCFKDHKLYTFTYEHPRGFCYYILNKTKYDWYTCHNFEFSNWKGAGLQMSRETKRHFFKPTTRYQTEDSDGEIPQWDRPGPEIHQHEFTVAPGQSLFIELEEFGYRHHKRQQQKPRIENDFFNRNYSAKLSPLMVFPKEVDMHIFKKFVANKQVELAFQDCDVPVCTTFDQFKKNEFKNDYFCVIFAILADDTDPADLRHMTDYFKHYGSAPICTWVTRSDLLDVVKPAVQLHHNVSFIYKYKKRDFKKAKRIAQAIDHCQTTHAEKMNTDVIPSFNKFDTDQSGAIDKDELGELSATLGNKLTQEQLDRAMIDLDLDGSGDIDLDEFSRWYFTGMNSYGDMQRTMLTGNSVAASMIDQISDDLYEIMQQDLRTKKHKINFSYNNPSDIGTEIELAFHLVGSHYNEYKVRMNQYEGSLDLLQMKKNKLKGHQNTHDFMYPIIEVVLGPFENPQEHIDMLEDALYEAMKEDDRLQFFPKIHHRDGNIVCGFKYPVEKSGMFYETQVPENMQTVLAGIDQSIKLKLDLNTSVTQWLDNLPILEAMHNGFRVSLEAEVISNVKHAIIEQIKNAQGEENSSFSKVAKTLLTLSPLFLMSLNANLDIKFKDFELIKKNPLANKLMLTLPDLLKTCGYAIPKNFQRVDLDKPKFATDPEKDSERVLQQKNELSGLHDVLTLLSDVVKDKTQMIQYSIMLPNLGVFHATVKSKDLIQIPKFCVQGMYKKAVERLDESDSEEEEDTPSDEDNLTFAQYQRLKERRNKRGNQPKRDTRDDDSSGDEKFKQEY